MKRSMVTSAALVAMAAAGAGVARAAGPATTRGVGELVEVDPGVEGPIAETGLLAAHVRVRLAPGAGVPTTAEFGSVLGRLRWRIPDRPDVVWRVEPGAFSPSGDVGILTYHVAVPSSLAAGLVGVVFKPEDAGRANQVLVEGLRDLVRSDAPTGDDQRRRRVAEIEAELARVRAMKGALKAMAAARPSETEAVGKRVEALRAEEQRLGMELAAKEARRVALQRAIDLRRSRAANDRQNDPVLEQLRAVQKLRENEVQRLEAMARSNAAPTSAVEESQARLAEARMKVAEREAEVGKAGKGELLDRLADELTMVAVDHTDLQIQLDGVRAELRKLNPATATTQSLEEVLREGVVPSGAGAAGMPPLYGELEEREWQLVREKVVLQVEDVEAVK